MLWQPRSTQDGSFTFFSEEFGETFHSDQGARSEAFVKFAAATDLKQRAQQSSVRLLDVCYGLGYNTAAAIETIWAVNPACQIDVYGLELDDSVPKAASIPPIVNQWSNAMQQILSSIAFQYEYRSSLLQVQLLIGDARQTVQKIIQTDFQADAILFDPFSPRRCPQLWTVEFLQAVTQCLAATGKLATYSRSAAVRSAMQATGLAIGTIPLGETHLPHEWSQGTVASFEATTLHPLSQMEQEHLQTRAAIPYRDPTLTDSAAVILQRHQQEQARSTLESTSSWRRRWGIK